MSVPAPVPPSRRVRGSPELTDEPGPEGWAREPRLAQAADARCRPAGWNRLGAEEATRSTILEGLARAGRGACRDLGPAGAHHGSVAERGPDPVRLAVHDRWRYLRLCVEEVPSRQAGTWVTLVLTSGAPRTGRVAAVGIDVITLAGDLPAGSAYLSSSAVAAVLGDGSG